MSTRSLCAYFALASLSLACGTNDYLETKQSASPAEHNDAGGDTAPDDDEKTEGGAAGQAPNNGDGGNAGDGGGGVIPPCIGHPKFHCHEDLLMRCNPDLDRYEFVKQCLPGLCSADDGACGGCTPGEALGCDGPGTQLICGPLGLAESVPCSDALPICAGGTCVACAMDADCTQPANECRLARCENNTCVIVNALSGSPSLTQTAHDCQALVCDGQGHLVTVADPADTPLTENSCQTALCVGTTPSFELKPEGAACAPAGTCRSNGTCVECLMGARKCAGPHAQQLCNEILGTWQSPTQCSSASPGCGDEGKCTTVIQLALGAEHSCALLDDGSVRCWGSNSHGQLGIGKAYVGNLYSEPVAVTALSGKVTALAAGAHHTCARIGGSLYCWGKNTNGQVPSSVGDYAASPVKAELTGSVSSIALGFDKTCYVDTNQKLFCTNSGGILQQEPLAQPVVQAAIGALHMCARTTTGDVYCSGDHLDGRLGGGPLINGTLTWVKAITNNISTIYAGGAHTLAIRNGNNSEQQRAFVWGNNIYGQAFFHNTTQAINAPVETPLGSLATLTHNISAGGIFSCAILPNRQIVCSGDNTSGQLGLGHNTKLNGESITPVKNISTANLLASGGEHSCARLNDGSLWCWGKGKQGQLGNGQLNNAFMPERVSW